MPLKLNKNTIWREVKTFLLALGAWVVMMFTFMLTLSIFFLQDFAGWIAALLATSVSLFLAYRINEKRIPILTLSIYTLYALTTFGQIYVLGPMTAWEDGFPSLKHQTIWIEHVSKRVKEPKRGDLITVNQNNGSFVMKRVIGLPGEEVEVFGNFVKINGKWLNEPYVEKDSTCFIGNYRTTPLTNSFKPSDGNYIVLYDNREFSGHEYWQDNQIFRDNIRGRAIGQEIDLKLSSTPNVKLNEFNSSELEITFSYSNGCKIDKQKDSIEIKNKKNNLTIFRITNIQNKNKLSLEKFLEKKFTIIKTIYCGENENCKIKPGNNLFEVTNKGEINSYNFVTGNLKTIENNNPNISFKSFIEADDKIYEVQPLNQDLLKQIEFRN